MKLRRIYGGKSTTETPEDVTVVTDETKPPYKVVCPLCGDYHTYIKPGLVYCKKLYPPLMFLLTKEDRGKQ